MHREKERREEGRQRRANPAAQGHERKTRGDGVREQVGDVEHERRSAAEHPVERVRSGHSGAPIHHALAEVLQRLVVQVPKIVGEPAPNVGERVNVRVLRDERSVVVHEAPRSSGCEDGDTQGGDGGREDRRARRGRAGPRAPVARRQTRRPGAGKPRHISFTSPAMRRDQRLVARRRDDLIHPGGEPLHLGAAHAARGDRGRADAEARRIERLARIERDRVVVGDDAGAIERLGGGLAGDVLAREIDKHQVVVGAAGRSRRSRGTTSASASDLRVLDHDLLRVLANDGLRRLARGDRDAGGRVVVRAALETGEDGVVDRRGVLLLAEDHAAARTAERLVRRRGDDVGDADRRRMHAGADEARDVRDVRGEDRADLVGDRRGTPRSRACAGRRWCRPRSASACAPSRASRTSIHVDAVVLAANAVGHALEVLAR